MVRFLIFLFTALLVGCGAGKSTEINTPGVDITDTDDHRKVNSVGRYEQCKKDLMQFLPADTSQKGYADWLFHIEQKCYDRTANPRGAGTGMVTGELVAVPRDQFSYPGMNAPTDPGFYRGLPGNRPVIIPSSSGMWVPGGSTSSEDTELLLKSQLNQEKRLCELERAAGRPCKK